MTRPWVAKVRAVLRGIASGLGYLAAGCLFAAAAFSLVTIRAADGVDITASVVPYNQLWVRLAVGLVGLVTLVFARWRILVGLGAMAVGTLAAAAVAAGMVWLLREKFPPPQTVTPDWGLILLAAGGGVLVVAAGIARLGQPRRYE